MLVQIDVTQECIDSGVCHSPSRCAVAVAIKKHLKPEYSVTVNPVSYSISDIGTLRRRHVECFPKEIGDFIRRFDLGEACEPFTLTLEIPDEFINTSPEVPESVGSGSVAQE